MTTRRRGAVAALFGLLMLLPLAPGLVRQAVFTVQADALTARLEHQIAIDEATWSASHGPADAELVIAALLPEQLIVDGVLAPMRRAARERLDLIAQDASRLIPEWSGGRHRVRLELRSSPIPVTVIDDGEGGRWPNPVETTTIAEGLFADLAPDIVLVLWGDARVGIAGAAGLATHRPAFGRNLPYLAIPDPGVDIRRDSNPGEILVHEFGHALEFLSEQQGEERPDLHRPQDYGFSDTRGSYEEWYRFFFAHPTEAIADAAGRSPLPTPVASDRPFDAPRTPIRWHP